MPLKILLAFLLFSVNTAWADVTSLTKKTVPADDDTFQIFDNQNAPYGVAYSDLATAIGGSISTGPWTLSGSYIKPTTITNNVGIGTAVTLGSNLNVYTEAHDSAILGKSKNTSNGYAIEGWNSYTGAGNAVGVAGHADQINGIGVNGYCTGVSCLGGLFQGYGTAIQADDLSNSGGWGVFADSKNIAIEGDGTGAGSKSLVTLGDDWGLYAQAPRNYFSGNVGIGTTQINYILDINKYGTSPTVNIEDQNTTSSPGLNISSDDGAFSFWINGSATDNSNFYAVPGQSVLEAGGSTGMTFLTDGGTGTPIIFATGGADFSSERMRIDKNGNIGIGSSNPGFTLDINSSEVGNKQGSITLTGGNGGASLYGAGINGGFELYSDGAALVSSLSEGKNILHLEGETHLISGNLGIGSTSPGTALDVTGAIRASNGFRNGVGIGTSGTGGTSCLCKTFSGGICTVIGTCT